MHLIPRDHDRLLLSQAGFLAQRRLARGLRLNQTEAIALIASQLQERIRDGAHSVAQLMSHGKEMLGRRHVLSSVPSQIHQIQVEGTFRDGVFLVTVHDPICTEDGDIEAALYGSFLPIPPDSAFPPHDPSEYAPQKQPGAIILHKSDEHNGRITINKGRQRVKIRVTNNGDRPIQVGSHYHFLETNPHLSFDRGLAYAKRLDIPAGTAVRFEPGDTKSISLVPISGRKFISGGNDLSCGRYNDSLLPSIIEKIIQQEFAYVPEPSALVLSTDTEVERETYVSMYGPTTGDRIRLGDTELWVEIEWDEGASVYGEEAKFGGGKTIREGMAQATNRSSEEVMDLVLTNAVIIDWQGIYKADIGIKNGLIAGIGKAGNPDISPTPVVNGFIKPLIPIGSSTEILSCENLIVTPGTIDVHVHYICPQQITEALASGTTTFIGGGTGPAEGTKATTCTSSEFYLAMMMRACDKLPGNFGFTGKGNDAGQGGYGRPAEGDRQAEDEGECKAIEEIVKAGACGLKLHEDWGSTPSTIRRAMSLADKYDVQVNIHTDTLNESGFVEQTIKAFEGRTIHTYHTEGAGGGHAPDVIRLCGEENVLPSSTNPTRPFARNTLDEHLDMLMVCHHLSRQIPEDISFAESRIRAETVAAEDVLHDLGAISMISSDSQAMGRIAEVVARTWRTASKMRQFRGPLASLGDSDLKDNARVKRYISKYTINPAITHGISHVVGDISVGKMADLVGWEFGRFGSSSGPEWVVKGGVVVWAQMGDANASVPTVEPCWGRPMWGAVPGFGGRSLGEDVSGPDADLNLRDHHSAFFVSRASLLPSNPSGLSPFQSYNLSKPGISVRSCRNLKKGHMKWNGEVPKVEVDPESYDVKVDGVRCDVEPAEEVCLGIGYNLF